MSSIARIQILYGVVPYNTTVDEYDFINIRANPFIFILKGTHYSINSYSVYKLRYMINYVTHKVLVNQIG